MKPIHLIVLAVVAAAGYFFWKSQNNAPTTSAPVGGAQTVAPRDPFAATANAINAVFAALSSISQTQPRTHG
jgi:hypothetical protein